MPRPRPPPSGPGLSAFRRGGAVTELLLLYECLVTEPTQLRPMAEALGVTVQAVSHSCRQLSRRGLLAHRDGRYRPTVAGVAWLHEVLGGVREDVERRLGRLHVIQSCRAVALDDLPAGASVSLELVDGILSARAGTTGASRGTAAAAARRGALVEVVRLEGILPLVRGPVRVFTLAPAQLDDRRLGNRLRRLAASPPTGVLGAPGLEAYHLLSGATPRPVLRFGVAAACLEASRLGVPSTVVLLDSELPRFLEAFEGPDPPPLEVARLTAPRRRTVRSG